MKPHSPELVKTNHAIAFALITAATVTSLFMIRGSAQTPSGSDQPVT